MDKWKDRSLNVCWMERWMDGQLEGACKLNVSMNVGYMDGRMLSGYWVNRLKGECWIHF